MPPAVLERNADVWDSLRTLGAPTVSELAEHTGRPPRAVGEALDQLRSQGLAEWAGWWGHQGAAMGGGAAVGGDAAGDLRHGRGRGGMSAKHRRVARQRELQRVRRADSFIRRLRWAFVGSWQCERCGNVGPTVDFRGGLRGWFCPACEALERADEGEG